MSSSETRYRFFLIKPFRLPPESPYAFEPGSHDGDTPQLMNYDHLEYKRLLDDVRWEVHSGPLAPYGDWMVENREEFAIVGAAVLPIVRQACESGKWNAIILLGGGEPGVFAAREIGKKHAIPVVSVGHAQMHVASMLGSRFSVIDLADNHSSHYASQIVQHGMADRCASIRLIDFPLPRPNHETPRSLAGERDKALRGEPCEAVGEAVQAAAAAVEEDGADVIMFGCSLTFWLQPFVQSGLKDLGWDVPVLEGFSCAISQARLLVDLGLDASGVAFPPDRPRRLHRKKLV